MSRTSVGLCVARAASPKSSGTAWKAMPRCGLQRSVVARASCPWLLPDGLEGRATSGRRAGGGTGILPAALPPRPGRPCGRRSADGLSSSSGGAASACPVPAGAEPRTLPKTPTTQVGETCSSGVCPEQQRRPPAGPDRPAGAGRATAGAACLFVIGHWSSVKARSLRGFDHRQGLDRPASLPMTNDQMTNDQAATWPASRAGRVGSGRRRGGRRLLGVGPAWWSTARWPSACRGRGRSVARTQRPGLGGRGRVGDAPREEAGKHPRPWPRSPVHPAGRRPDRSPSRWRRAPRCGRVRARKGGSARSGRGRPVPGSRPVRTPGPSC